MKSTNEIFVGMNNILYSHIEQKGMIKCSYSYLHRLTGKTGQRDIWLNTIKDLSTLCKGWNNDKWFYLPITF